MRRTRKPDSTRYVTTRWRESIHLPAWLIANAKWIGNGHPPLVNLWACREGYKKQATLLLDARRERVGLYDIDTLQLAWFVEWLEFKLLHRRYLSLPSVEPFTVLGHRLVLAPESVSTTGVLPTDGAREREAIDWDGAHLEAS